MSETINDGIVEVNRILRARRQEILPEDKSISTITKEEYQSVDFRKAGFQYIPQRYGTSDRTLVTLGYEDGSQIFIIEGRVQSDNPFEIMHAVDGGLDLRKKQVIVYKYDGQGTITEIGPNGETQEYTGDYGTPEALLPSLRDSLGVQVGSTQYTNETSPSSSQ